MTVTTTKVASVEELQQALADDHAADIVVAGAIQRVPTFRLAPGRNLVGADDRAALVFLDGADGIQLTRDNRVAVCAGHHLHGIHANRVRAWGTAPDGITWELGVRAEREPLLRLAGDRYVGAG